jgi:bifunctional NMN adenylyltransferase/nudix hydrolase
MYEYTVFIGRFQPFHLGHLNIVKQALLKSKRLIILVGSANRARDIRNPWSYHERCEMINSSLTLAEKTRILFAPLPDYLYQNNAWVENVQKIVYRVVEQSRETENPSIALIGHSKDSTSFYLKLFPQWESINVPNVSKLNSTDIRNKLFSDEPLPVENYLPVSIYNWITDWRWATNPKIFNELQYEYNFVKAYKEQWKTKKEGGSVPYPVIFQTVDNVVVQSGHVLLVKRGASPGKGMWALPGGFVNSTETLLEAAIRELREETQLKVPEPVLLGSLKAEKTFDDPYRSVRGRTISHGFYFQLKDMHELPKIKGSDDAVDAQWVPLAKIRADLLFEDHFYILSYFINLK